MKITTDKLKHFGVCLAITVAVAFVIKGMGKWYGDGIPKFVCGAIGAIVALVLGGAKEAYDRVQGKDFNLMDLAADVVGVFVGLILSLMM